MTMNLSDCQLLILFGGSFDPVHQAHTTLPMIVRKKLSAKLDIEIDKIVVGFIPAAQSPLKMDRPPAKAPHRLAMLKLALNNTPGAVIFTDELDCSGDQKPSRTIDTLQTLRRRLPETLNMRLLIGADQLLDFDKWVSHQKIIQLAEPLVMIRPPHTRESLLTKLPDDQRNSWKKRLIDVPKMDVSATEIRRRLKEGKTITGMVPHLVAKYIDDHHLYEQ